MGNGRTYSVQYGYLRHALRMMSSWNLLRVSIKSTSKGGNWWADLKKLVVIHLTFIQKCSLCGVREGACIQCSKASCFLAFHATCARKFKLLMPMKAAHGAEPATLACYCEKHLPVSHQPSRTDSVNFPNRKNNKLLTKPLWRSWKP